MKNQASISSPNPTNPVEMFANENTYVNLSTQNLKRTIMNLLKESKGLKKTQRNGSIRLQRQS